MEKAPGTSGSLVRLTFSPPDRTISSSSDSDSPGPHPFHGGLDPVELFPEFRFRHDVPAFAWIVAHSLVPAYLPYPFSPTPFLHSSAPTLCLSFFYANGQPLLFRTRPRGPGSAPPVWDNVAGGLTGTGGELIFEPQWYMLRNVQQCEDSAVAISSTTHSSAGQSSFAQRNEGVGTSPDPPETRAAHHLATCRTALKSDRAVAHILGVSPSQVSRWRSGQIPDPDNADRLGGLAFVVEMLGRWLARGSIESWLRGPNAHLSDRTPAYLIRQGQLADVIGAIEAEKAGVYA